LEIEESIWEKGLRKEASMKNLGPHHRAKGGIHTKKRKCLLVVKRGERGGTSICGRSAKKRIHLIL